MAAPLKSPTHSQAHPALHAYLHLTPYDYTTLRIPILVMHTIARASSFGPLSSGSGALAYPYHHQPASFGATHKSLSEPCTPSEPSSPLSTAGTGPSVPPTPMRTPSGSQVPPARGCLKEPTKEFVTKAEPAEAQSQPPVPPPGRHAPGARQRPKMKLERVPTSAIARIQMSEGVEPHMVTEGGNGINPGARGKCKERVPTPYVKSDKASWLSDGEE